MIIATPQTDTVIVGFDSAWTDSPKAPGAVCAIGFNANGVPAFYAPQLSTFAQALAFIHARSRDYSLCLVALDQPTIVPNASGCRPVDRIAGSLISFIGGGVQPASASKIGMFCDRAPIWKFKLELGAQEEPGMSRSAQAGLFLIEVFPALALPALQAPFSERLRGPKYNPANRRTFRMTDWQAVNSGVAAVARDLGVGQLAEWATMVLNYTRACEDVFWRGAKPDSYILKTIGVQALFDILRQLAGKAYSDRRISEEYFVGKLEGARGIDFSEDVFKNPSGSGRTFIRREIEAAIFIG